jgi:hypothetical protein
LDGIGGQNENFHEPLFEGNVFVEVGDDFDVFVGFVVFVGGNGIVVVFVVVFVEVEFGVVAEHQKQNVNQKRFEFVVDVFWSAIDENQNDFFEGF